MKKSIKPIKAEAFDKAFEEGDVSEFLDRKTAKAHFPTQRLSIDFTKHMIDEVDQEALKIGVTRTALIKIWIAEKLSKIYGRQY